MNILETAKHFTMNAHNSINQRRKYDNQPYYLHCERVVKILSEVTQDEIVLASAWMHDILEDVAPVNTDFSEEEIRRIFGNKICEIIIELTDCKLNEGNRATRKAIDRKRLSIACSEAKTIKLADLIDNFIDIQRNDPGFCRIIAEETERLLPCLADGNQILFARLSEILTNYKKNKKLVTFHEK